MKYLTSTLYIILRGGSQIGEERKICPPRQTRFIPLFRVCASHTADRNVHEQEAAVNKRGRNAVEQPPSKGEI